jgi:hypothetical protein
MGRSKMQDYGAGCRGEVYLLQELYMKAGVVPK